MYVCIYITLIDEFHCSKWFCFGLLIKIALIKSILYSPNNAWLFTSWQPVWVWPEHITADINIVLLERLWRRSVCYSEGEYSICIVIYSDRDADVFLSYLSWGATWNTWCTETQRPRETFTKTFLSFSVSVIADSFPFLCGAVVGQAKWTGLKMSVWVLKGAFVIFITFECAAVESVTAVPECHISSPFFIKMQNTMNVTWQFKEIRGTKLRWEAPFRVQPWTEESECEAQQHELIFIYIYIYTAANTYPEMNWVYVLLQRNELTAVSLSLSLQTYSEETDIDLPTPSTKR